MSYYKVFYPDSKRVDFTDYTGVMAVTTLGAWSKSRTGFWYVCVVHPESMPNQWEHRNEDEVPKEILLLDMLT